MSLERPLLLAGHPRWTAEAADVRAPWDGRLLARVAQAGPEDAGFAAAAAARAFDDTRRMTARRRSAILGGLAASLRDAREPLARLLSDEGGKPRTLARAELDAAVTILERCAEDAHQVAAEISTTGGRLALSRAMPRGPVLALTAADQPLVAVCAVLGPAVAAGCPIVVRPARATPCPALALGEALVEQGWPGDAISVLPCDDGLAAALVADPRFATISLGRDTPGAAWVAAHLRRRNVLAAPFPPVTLLVEPDADLDLAIPAIVHGAYAHAGQTRAWAQRVLVHQQLWGEVCERFAAATAAVPRGDPARDDVLCGPLIDRRGLARAEAWIRDAEQLGGRRLVGGDREGPVLTPAALAGEAPYFELLDGAPSGPVAVLEPYPHLDSAIDRVNAHPRRGDTAIFTRCIGKVWQVYERMEAGTLVHDAHPDFGGPLPEPRATLDALLVARTLRFGPVPGTA